MSLNKFTSDFERKEWMKINAKVLQSEIGQFETLQSNSFETLELKIDNDLEVGDVKYTGNDGNNGDVLTTDGNGNTSFQPGGGGGWGYIGNFRLYEKVVSIGSDLPTFLVSKNLTNNYLGNINSGLTWNVGDSYRFEVSGSWTSNGASSTLQSLSFDGNTTQITSGNLTLATGMGGNGSWRFICHFSVKEVNGSIISLVQSNNFQWMNNSDSVLKCKSSNGDLSSFNLNNLDITFVNQFNGDQSTIWVYGFEFVPTHQTVIS